MFDIDIQHCPNCGGGELKIIAAILKRPLSEKILAHLGPDPQPPSGGHPTLRLIRVQVGEWMLDGLVPGEIRFANG